MRAEAGAETGPEAVVVQERLTRAQRLALALDRNLSVTAGAGTGKTRVLTKRFLRVLALGEKKDDLGGHPGVRPSQVVAVTFTRKAASEMRERVTREVTKQVRGAQEVGDAKRYAYWVQVRRELEEATIQTIHGLAARLVRLSALELGIDPRFRIVEGIDARLMVEEAIAGVLSAPPEESLWKLRELYVLRGARDVRGILRALVTDRVHADRWAAWLTDKGVKGALDWLWQTQVPLEKEEARRIIDEVARMHGDLERKVKVQPPQEAKAHAFLQAVAGCAQAGDHRACVRALWGLLDCCTSEKGEWYKGANHATGPAREWDAMGLPGEHKTVYEALEGPLRPLVGRLEGVPDEADEGLLELLVALARVYQEVVARYDERKNRRGLLDYHDLEVHAKRALLLPGVAETLRRQIRYLLVDEFQDTNEDQWTILRELARDPVELSLDGGEETGTAPVDLGGWSSAEELESGAATRSQKRPGRSTEQGSTGKDGEESFALVELEDDSVPGEDGLGEDRLFIVGDAKQSIYAFRGADVTVYEGSREAVREANRSHGLHEEPPELEELDPQELGGLDERELEGEVALDENFRSLPGLVRFANAFFDHLLAPEDAEEGRRRYEAEPGPLKPDRKALVAPEGEQDQESVEGSVRLLVTPYHLDSAVERGELSPEEADRLGRTRYAFARMVQDIRDRIDGPAAARYRATHEGNGDGEGKAWRPAQYKDVAILLPRKTNLRLLEEQFRLHGVPYVVVGGRGFWSKQEVYDAVNLLAVITEPERDIELFSVLRSAFFAWSDEALALLSSLEGRTLWARLRSVAKGEAEWDPPVSFRGVPPEQVVESLKRWRSRSRATSASRLLTQIYTETPYLASLGAQEPESSGRLGVENLEKLVELTRELEKRRGLSLAPLVRDLLALTEEDEEEAEAVLPGEEEEGVRVMTVHAAKGLEFPVVYVAELDARLPGGSLGEAMGVQSDRLDGVPMYALKARGENGEPEDCFLDRLVRQRARLRSRAEYKRLLYVAMTRAEDHLVLVGSSERSGPKRGKTPPGLKPLSAGWSWMDWVEKILDLSPPRYEEILAKRPRVEEIVLEPEQEEPARVTVDLERVDLETRRVGDEDPRVRVTPPSAQETQDAQAVRQAPALAPAPPGSVRVSPSQLLVYAECQARFRYRVLERIDEGWVRGVDPGVPVYGEVFGSLLHRALAVGAHGKRPVPEPIAKRARSLAERYREKGWPSPERFLSDLEDHARRAVEALKDLSPAVLVESKVDAQIAPGVRAVGRLDRVHRDKDGRLVVVDLKTDAVEASQEERHAVDHGHAAQVLLYDEALRHSGCETAPPGVLYTATGRLVRVDPEEGEGLLNELRVKITESRNLAQDGEGKREELEAIWPKSAASSKVCQGCGYWRESGGPCEGIGGG